MALSWGQKAGWGGISAIGQAGAFVLGLSLYIMLRCGLYLVLPSNNATVVTRKNSGAAIEGAFWRFGYLGKRLGMRLRR